MSEPRVILQMVVARFRELVTGLVMPTRGGCVCDPVAWERDARARMAKEDSKPRHIVGALPREAARD